MKHDALTTELLRNKFKNNFDLCNFAISVGQVEILKDPESMTLRRILDAVDISASARLLEENQD